MAAVPLPTLDVAVLVAVYNVLRTTAAFHHTESPTLLGIQLPTAAVLSIYRTVKLIIAIVLRGRLVVCDSAIKDLLWSLQASLGISGLCCG